MADINQKRQLAQLIFDAMNSRDFSEVQPFLSEDVILNFPGVGDVEGLKRVIIFMKTLLRKYPKLTFSVLETIVEKDRAVAVWTNEGESALGIPYTNSGNTLFYFSEGKISFISDYFKDTSFTDN